MRIGQKVEVMTGPCAGYTATVTDSAQVAGIEQVCVKYDNPRHADVTHGTFDARNLWGVGKATTVRKRPLVHLSLSPSAISRLAEIATRCGETRSGAMERLIREAEMPRPMTAAAPKSHRGERGRGFGGRQGGEK